MYPQASKRNHLFKLVQSRNSTITSLETLQKESRDLETRIQAQMQAELAELKQRLGGPSNQGPDDAAMQLAQNLSQEVDRLKRLMRAGGDD